MNNIQASYCANILKVSFVLIVLLPTMVLSECTNNVEESEKQKKEALKYKLAVLATILVAGALGVSLPLLSRKIPQLSPENDMFFMIKAFAAGVILATGFIHILPNGFHNLTSPCLKQNPWGKFPFSGFVAMMSSILTLTVDSFATGFYKRLVANNKSKGVKEDEEEGHDQSNHTAVPKHSTVGHAHGSDLPEEDLSTSELIRMRIISQVLELGVVVHSVIIGMSLGVSKNPETIKPLLVALSFHQFFEGLGLGGSICQAKFKSRSMTIMATFFSLTTPVGIAIGISISRVYQASSPAALIVEGTLESASAGILMYMALVDLLAEDFMNPRLQTNLRLQLGSYVSLLLGTGCMSLLAYWV